MNPFTLKELRQLTRSRFVSFLLMAFLMIAFAGSYFLPLGDICGTSGRTLFVCVYAILWLVLGAMLPVMAFSRLSKERGTRRQSADWTLMTALPPKAVIDGKICAALALTMLFVSATLPFAVASYLLHGISPVEMAKMLLLIAVFSSMMVNLALCAASMKFARPVRNIVFAVFFFLVGLVGAGISAGSTMSDSSSWRSFAVLLAVLVSISLLLRAYAIAFLSPAVMDRDGNVRTVALVLAAAWGVYVLWYGRMHWNIRDFVGAFQTYLFAVSAMASATALLSFAIPSGYSRRMVASRPGAIWRRIVEWPFRTGTSNGFFFACALAAAVSVAAWCFQPWINEHLALHDIRQYVNGKMEVKTLERNFFEASFFMYFFSVLLCVRWLWRQASRRFDISPGLVPFAAIAVFAFLASLPVLVEMQSAAEPGCMDAALFNLRGIKDCPFIHLYKSACALLAALLLNILSIHKL